MADAFPISGQIDPKAFPFLVMDLHHHGATGSLKVEGPSYQKALYFRNGRILFGSSNDPRDQLGAILIESGKISPEQLEDVNTKVGPGSPLAKVLAETGFVNQRELSEAARAKVERILSDLIAYEAGSFEFEDGVLPKGAVDLKLSTERVVLAAVRRVADRNFVLRHLEGLDVVLAPTAQMAERLPEVQGDAGGLPDLLDGRSTLKDAAARTRLDEFEAAKIACALLFLGMVERRDVVGVAEVAAAAVEDEAPTFVPAEDESPDFEVDGSSPTVIMSASDVPRFEAPPESDDAAPVDAMVEEPESTGFELNDPARFAPPPPPEDEPTVKVPDPPPPEADADATVWQAAPAPSWEPPPAPGWEPPPPTLPIVVPSIGDAQTLRQQSPTAEELEGMSSPAPVKPAPRPSKDDLAALDALLNADASPTVDLRESPARLSPRPSVPTFGQRRGAPAPPSRAPLFIGVGALLLLAAGAGWWLTTRPRKVAVATASPATAPTTTLAPVTTTVPPAPASAAPIATTLAAAPPPTTTAPAPRPSVAAPRPAATAPPPAAAADAASLLQKGDFSQAARSFAARVKAAPPASASLQLMVACSTDTVQKAVQNTAGGHLLVLAVNYKGRDCYRLAWGLYPSAAAASAAASTVPDYFQRGGLRGRVVPASELLQ